MTASRARSTGVGLALIPVLVVAILLASCVSSDSPGPWLLRLKATKDRVALRVPLIIQNDSWSCGTTAIAMALSCYRGGGGAPIDQDEAWRLSQSDPEFAMTRGFDIPGFHKLVTAFGYSGWLVDNLGLDRLRALLSHGILVVMLVRPDPDRTNTHAVLAVGYDDNARMVLVNDPAGVRTQYSYDELSGAWMAGLGNPSRQTVQAGYIIVHDADTGS